MCHARVICGDVVIKLICYEKLPIKNNLVIKKLVINILASNSDIKGFAFIKVSNTSFKTHDYSNM